MRRIALLYHPKIAESVELAGHLEQFLRSDGFSVWVGSAWEDEKARKMIPDMDLIVTMGGDGTILRAARMAGHCGTPILGVNMGRLGFLTETEPGEAADKLPGVLSGDYWLEERIMLHAELHRQDQQQASHEALNDVVVGHGLISRPVRLAITLDSQPVANYVADGVIVATPTGSTAYSLAAGGPILHPQLTDILLTPIAPHRALDRALVLPAKSLIEIQLSAEYEAVLTIDGQIDIPLVDGDRVLVSVSPHRCNLVRTRPRNYFGHSLLERLRQ
jgi:NAD+ kinase